MTLCLPQKNVNYPLGKLSNGHDFALIMQAYIKVKHNKQRSATNLEEMITSSYLSADLLTKSNVYKEVRDYGISHNINIF